MKFLALDFETGGLTPQQKVPVTLGLAVFENGHVIRSAEWAFKPLRDWNGKRKHDYSECAAEIHGKSLAWLEEHGQTWARIYTEVLAFLDGTWSDPIISHNAPFDSEVWSNFLFGLSEYDRDYKAFATKREMLIGPWLDTKRIAQSRFLAPYDVENLKLDTLCKHFGLGAQGDIHGAEADAILCGRLYCALNSQEALF
jgi:DNA polymerase III epsilon subunit-like protein